MHLRLNTLFCLIFLSILSLSGQNVPIGEWLDHLPYLRTAGGLDDHAIPGGKLKTGWVKVIHLDSARKYDSYDFGH